MARGSDFGPPRPHKIQKPVCHCHCGCNYANVLSLKSYRARIATWRPRALVRALQWPTGGVPSACEALLVCHRALLG